MRYARIMRTELGRWLSRFRTLAGAGVLAAALLAPPAMAQVERPGAASSPEAVFPVSVVVGSPPVGPRYRRAPEAPRPGRRRALPLRTDFRARVLASAGAL